MTTDLDALEMTRADAHANPAYLATAEYLTILHNALPDLIALARKGMQAQEAQEGYVRVPVEPTGAELKAMLAVWCEDGHPYPLTAFGQDPEIVYRMKQLRRAMLAAAQEGQG